MVVLCKNNNERYFVMLISSDDAKQKWIYQKLNMINNFMEELNDKLIDE